MKTLSIIIIAILLNSCNNPININTSKIKIDEIASYGASIDNIGEVTYIGNGLQYEELVYSEGPKHGAWCKTGYIFSPENDTIVVSEYYEIRYPDPNPTWFVRTNSFPMLVIYKTDINNTFSDTLEFWYQQN